MTLVQLRDMRSLAARNPLATAFVLSLLIHLGLYQVWQVGKKLGWWQHQATWLLHLNKKKSRPPMLVQIAEKKAAAQAPAPKREIPLTFVEVDPATVAPEPPKEASYYGQRNSRAANPDPTVETSKPKLEGQQDKMVRLKDIERPKPFPLQPSAPPETKTTREAEPKPKPSENPGDLAKALLNELKRPDEGQTDFGAGQAPQREKPRTVAEARAQQGLAGQRMRQDGGVATRGRVALDVKATPFGAYDAAFIAAVQQRWYDLLDHTPFTQRAGKVVLDFHLTVDGQITNMKIAHNEVGELLSGLCVRAVQDPAPYAKWPSDMRRMIGANYREVTFTFYYY